MPLLALLYVVLMCLLGLDALTSHIKERKPVWFTALNLVSIAIMILMFTGYWVSGLVESIGICAPALLLFSLVWEICTAREIGLEIERHCQNVTAEARILAKRFYIAFEIIVCGIAYWFGGIAVLRVYGRT
jgi:hypothetical protein